MLPNYPLLERLILRGCCFENVYICAPKLKYLELGTLSCRGYRFGTKMFLCTPKLTFVKLDNVVLYMNATDNFLFLQKVEFSLDYEIPMLDDDETKKEIVENQTSVFNLLQEANSITLDSIFLEVFIYMWFE